MWDLSNFYTSISKKYDEWKMQFMNNGFDNIQNEWSNSCANVNSLRNAKKIINPFKYKCEVLSYYVCFIIY